MTRTGKRLFLVLWTINTPIALVAASNHGGPFADRPDVFLGTLVWSIAASALYALYITAIILAIALAFTLLRRALRWLVR